MNAFSRSFALILRAQRGRRPLLTSFASLTPFVAAFGRLGGASPPSTPPFAGGSLYSRLPPAPPLNLARPIRPRSPGRARPAPANSLLFEVRLLLGGDLSFLEIASSSNSADRWGASPPKPPSGRGDSVPPNPPDSGSGGVTEARKRPSGVFCPITAPRSSLSRGSSAPSGPPRPSFAPRSAPIRFCPTRSTRSSSISPVLNSVDFVSAAKNFGKILVPLIVGRLSFVEASFLGLSEGEAPSEGVPERQLIHVLEASLEILGQNLSFASRTFIRWRSGPRPLLERNHEIKTGNWKFP